MAMEHKEWMFTWKDHLFVSVIDKGKICLKWTPLNPEAISKPPQNNEQFNLLSSPEQSDIDDISTTTTTSFDLDDEKEFRYLTCGFSFDPGCLDRVPVMVLFGSNLETKSARLKGSKRNYVCLLLSLKTRTLIPGVLNLEAPPHFEFVNLGTYNLTKKQRNIIFHQNPFVMNNFKVVSFLHMLSLDTQLANLDVYSTAGISSYSFFAADEHQSYKQFTILDVFCNHMSHETFLLFSYIDNNEVKNVNCVKFQTGNCESQSHSTSVQVPMSNTSLEIVSQRYLFPSDFLQLVIAVKLISVSSVQKSRNESIHYTSNLIIITNTGYLLYFVDGSMSSCIHIWNDLQEICTFTESDWASSKFNFVVMNRGSAERIAIQVNSACVLVDVEKEQIIKVWQTVSFIARTTSSLAPCLLIVMNSADDSDRSLWNLCDDRENIHQIDCFRVNSRGEVESDLQRQISEESGRSENQIPQFAVDAILAQKKKYETVMREAKIELAAKEQFLLETWEALQNLCVTKHGRQSHWKDPHLVPLLEDAQGADQIKAHTEDQPSHSKNSSQKSHSIDFCTSTSPNYCNKRRIPEAKMSNKNKASTYIQVLGEPWKRTIESLLVVGVHIRNTCNRPIVGAHSHLIPAGTCSFSMLECISGCSSALDSIEMFSTLPSSAEDISIQPGHERTLTCYVDTGQILSPEDSRFYLVVTFNVNNSAVQIERTLFPEQRHVNLLYNVSCGDVTLSTHDVISATYGVERVLSHKETDPADIALNILALDCIQRGVTFIIRSKVSSVLCLESKLESHPEFLKTCSCYIFVADHQLRLCRVKMLQQIHKKEGKLEIFTRTENQTVLFIKFLHSLLPDDVVLLPDLPPSSLCLQQARDVLEKELTNKISKIKEELADTNVDQPIELVSSPEPETSERDSCQPSLSSPTFHSKKNVWNRGGPKESSSGDKMASKVKGGGDSGNRVNEERKKFFKAKRRLNEKLGLHDS